MPHFASFHVMLLMLFKTVMVVVPVPHVEDAIYRGSTLFAFTGPLLTVRFVVEAFVAVSKVPVVAYVSPVLPATPLAEDAKRTCAATRFVVVARPAQLMTGVVPPVEKIGAVAVTEVTVPTPQAAAALTRSPPVLACTQSPDVRAVRYVLPELLNIVVDACWAFSCACNVVDAEKMLLPLNVLLFESSVELAAVIVSFVSPSVSVVEFTTIVEC